MFPAPPLGPWWTDHLQLPGYDPIATAGPSRFDPRAAEQALGFFTQLLPSPLSRWETAIVLNLWGWRQAQGQRRYVTVYAEPYRHDALALWCAILGLWVLRAAPPRRAPQVTVSYAQAPLTAESIRRWQPPSRRCPRGAPGSCSIQDATLCGHPRAARLPSPAPWGCVPAKCCCTGREASP